MASFSLVLKRLRENYGLTQEELANRLDISRSRLASYEQGQREPDLELLEIIADYFNVDLDYLLGRTNTTTKIDTIAAHKNNPDEDWTEAELKEIEDFKEFVRMKRKNQK